MRYLIINAIIILVSCFSGHAQISFYKYYTNNGNDFGQGIVQLEDSSYVITGGSSSFGDAPSDAFLLKIDSLGNYLWSRNYGGSESEWGRRVLYKKNFGYFLCGFTNSFGHGAYDFYLAKISESGTLDWYNAYGKESWEKVNDAALTKDTGVLMVGETRSNLTNNQDIYLVRTNKFGDTLWTKTIGGSGNDYASSIESYDDTMFMIGGQIYVEDSSLYKAFLMRIDENGLVYNMDTLGANGNYGINDLTINGNEVDAVGYVKGPTSNEEDVFYWNSDLNGNYSNLETVFMGGKNLGELITGYGDNSSRYIAYNIEDGSSYAGGPDLHIGRYSSSLYWIETQAFVRNENPDVGGQFIRTSDGGAILVGHTGSGGLGSNNCFVLKIGPNQMYPNTSLSPDVENLVAVANLINEKDLRVYPNPASSVLNINYSLDEKSICRIKNSLGQTIYENVIYHSETIDVSQFTNGLYFVEFSVDGMDSIIKKLIIAK